MADLDFALFEDGAPLEREAFGEAIRSVLQRQDILPKAEFLKLDRANRNRAFTVARVTNATVLQDLYEATTKAATEGQNFRDFRDSLNTVMEQRGWGGLEPWHAQLVFKQNMTMAYTAGRFQQAQSAGVGHWRYLPSDSQTPRPDHEVYYGKIFKLGEGPMPPLDFGCKCNWEPVFEDELDGETVQKQPPTVDAEQEFQFAPGDYFERPTVDLGRFSKGLRAAVERFVNKATKRRSDGATKGKDKNRRVA